MITCNNPECGEIMLFADDTDEKIIKMYRKYYPEQEIHFAVKCKSCGNEIVLNIDDI